MKKGIAPRGVGDQLHDYWGGEKAMHPNTPIELMVVANEIPRERKLHLANWNIESREISEKRFRDVASEVGYRFESERAKEIPVPVGKEPVLSSVASEPTISARPGASSRSLKESLVECLATRGEILQQTAELIIQKSQHFTNKVNQGINVLYFGCKQPPGRVAYLFGITESAEILVTLAEVNKFSPFALSPELRQELLDRINGIARLNKSARWKYSGFEITALQDPGKLDEFIHAMKWAVDQINNDRKATR